MNNPLVSLIMPVFNHESFISRSVGSIIDQDYENWELIVIDDGSTDASAKIIKDFNDPRIFYHFQENRGVQNLAETINKGLGYSKGQLVTMVPSDDSWPSNRLSIQVPLTLPKKIVLSYGCMNLIDENDLILGFSSPEKTSKSLDNDPVGSIFEYLLIENFIGEPTVLIKSKELKAIGGYLQPKGMLAEDYPTMLELAKRGEFKFINKTLANYRFHGSQMTNIHIVDMTKKDSLFVINFFRELPDNFKALAKWKEKELRLYWEEKIARSYFSLGRRLAYTNKADEAKQAFKTAFAKSNKFKTKAISFLGLFSVALGLNVEWMRVFAGNSVSLSINE